MKIIVSLILTLFILDACLPADKLYPIWINNNSNRSIYFAINAFEDSLLPMTNKYVLKIEAKDKISIDSHQSWEDVFSEKYPKDTLQIFIFNSDTIVKYDWETVRKSYKIIERRTYRKQDLQKAGWNINYP